MLLFDRSHAIRSRLFQDLKAVQNVGQIIGEVLKRLDEDRCKFNSFAFLRRLLHVIRD